MEKLSFGRVMVILGHAFVGWALCGAIMGIGMAVSTELNAQIAHAIGAPLIFIGISRIYFTKFNYTTPLTTATTFIAFALLMDFFVVSLLILGNFEMFESVLGLWIPMASIFAATLLTGLWLERKPHSTAIA